jgi:hypothetical protein
VRRVSGMIGRKRMWQLESALIGALGAMVAQKSLRVLYRSVRTDKTRTTPFDPSNARFTWPNALLWAAAAGVGLGIAKVMSARVAAVGWELATGSLPPGAEDPANGQTSA